MNVIKCSSDIDSSCSNCEFSPAEDKKTQTSFSQRAFEESWLWWNNSPARILEKKKRQMSTFLMRTWVWNDSIIQRSIRSALLRNQSFTPAHSAELSRRQCESGAALICCCSNGSKLAQTSRVSGLSGSPDPSWQHVVTASQPIEDLLETGES